MVAERCGTGGNHDDPSEMELVFGIGEKTCQQERGLTGDRDAGVLAQQCQSHGPIAVVGDERAQRMKNSGAHLVEDQYVRLAKRERLSRSDSVSVDEEIDERTIEFLGRLFVGQVADAFEGHQTGVAKIPAQRLGRLKMNGAVFLSPDDESGVITYFGKRRFEFREVRRPIPYHKRTVSQRVIFDYGYAVTLERIGRNF